MEVDDNKKPYVLGTNNEKLYRKVIFRNLDNTKSKTIEAPSIIWQELLD